jgi:hypothetical protein
MERFTQPKDLAACDIAINAIQGSGACRCLTRTPFNTRSRYASYAAIGLVAHRIGGMARRLSCSRRRRRHRGDGQKAAGMVADIFVSDEPRQNDWTYADLKIGRCPTFRRKPAAYPLSHCNGIIRTNNPVCRLILFQSGLQNRPRRAAPKDHLCPIGGRLTMSP